MKFPTEWKNLKKNKPPTSHCTSFWLSLLPVSIDQIAIDFFKKPRAREHAASISEPSFHLMAAQNSSKKHEG
jgi:hypothetical protein